MTIPSIRNRNVLPQDVDTPEEVAKIVNDLYRIDRAQNLAILKLSGKGEGKKGGETTPPGKVSAMKKAALAVIVFLLSLASMASASVPWMVEYAGNADLMDAFMRNPQFKNIETDTITMANGATFANSTNNAFTWTENSENIIWTVAATVVTVSSSTGVLTMDYDTLIVAADEMLFNPVTDANTTEGTVYYDSDDDNLYVRTTAGWVDLTSQTAVAAGLDTQIQYNNGGTDLGGISGFIWDDTNVELADDVSLAFGTSADWTVNFDDSVDDQLLFLTAGTACTATTDPMVEFIVGAIPTADQQVFGVAKGTQASNTALFTLDEDGDAVFAGTLTIAGDITMQNGATIGNSTDTEIVFGENSEDISFDFTTDGLTIKTSTGVAAIDWADTDDFTGLNNLTFDAAASAITLPANSANDDLTITNTGTQDSHLTISCAGTSEDAITISTSNGGINITNNGAALGEDLDLSSSTASLNLTAAEAVADAITLLASNAAGGITAGFGTGNFVITGTGASADFTVDCDLFSIDGTGTSNVTVTSTAGAEDFTVALAGAFDSSLILSSTGTGADALQVTASAATGGITMGFGTGNMVVTGTGVSADFTLDCDLFSIDGTGTSNVTVTSTAGSEDFTVALAGAFDSSLILSSTGTGADALQLSASAATGGITVAFGTGNMAITGTGVSADFTLDCDLLSIDATGTSNISFANGAGEDVTIATTGAADHSLILSASGTAGDALQLSASAATGGITAAFGTGNMAVTGTGVSADFTLDCDLFSIDGTGLSNITVTSNAGAEDFTVALAGATDSSLILSSTGTAADALQITASAGGVLVSPSGAMADQFKVLAAGTIAGNAINLATSDGGVVVTAAGAANGDLTLTVGDDWTATVTGNTSLTSTGTTAITTSDWSISTAGVMAKIDAITFDTGGAGIDCNGTQLSGFKYAVQHALANDTLAVDESGAVVYVAKAGAGAASDITITLPAAAAGLTFTIVDANETAAADVTIRAGAGDKINDGAAAAAYVHDTDADNYALCELVAIDDTDWVIVSSTGTWVNE